MPTVTAAAARRIKREDARRKADLAHRRAGALMGVFVAASERLYVPLPAAFDVLEREVDAAAYWDAIASGKSHAAAMALSGEARTRVADLTQSARRAAASR